jgi:hypothetical protein
VADCESATASAAATVVPLWATAQEDLELTQGEMQHDDDSYIRIDDSRLASPA